ncbi:MAG: zincin-like metallopeptidase domain-containing protein [Deltaproteobacteria bacterium]|nr:zincin-like metallopeptidase domain-containing protein [Deltaproteobacteria bacterium]
MAKERSKQAGPGKAEKFAETIIALLEEGAAPWQKPWKAGHVNVPHNPVSGTVYKGINRVMLSIRGLDDPRWLSLKQANEKGWRVRAGARSALVEHWQWTKKEQGRDEDGNLQYDDMGKPLMVEVRLERPRVRYFNVFHASQVQTLDGQAIPPYDPGKVDWNPNERAEAILENSGAAIFHDQADSAYYIMSKDEIHLPPQANFPEAALYYSTAMHELGHWTRHPSRLNRENGPFGSPSYAREELRAEIASWMLAQDLGLSFDPGPHISYCQDWIKALKEDPHEIVRAARDAEKIKQYLMSMELGLSQGPDQGEPFVFTDLPAGSELPEPPVPAPAQAAVAQAAALAPAGPAAERVWLKVPYAEKNKAKAAGAKWDGTAKLWFVPAGTNPEPLARWRPAQDLQPAFITLGPAEELGQVLASAGFNLNGIPVLDGKIHRVPVQGAASGSKDGAYCAHPDGRPSGWFKNHKTGLQGTWVHSSHVLTQDQKNALQTEALERQAERDRIRGGNYLEAARRAAQKLAQGVEANNEHPYLKAKGVESFGLSMDGQGNLLVPGLNLDRQEIQTIQTITPEGKKYFEPGAKKTGAVFLIGISPQAPAPPAILVAEGYSTGATLHQATGLPVAVAFDAGNLPPAGEALKRKFSTTVLTFCADNDHLNPQNPGLEKALAAARAVGGQVLVPGFTPAEKAKGFTDWNDLAKSRGLAAVIQGLSESINPPLMAPTISPSRPVPAGSSPAR